MWWLCVWLWLSDGHTLPEDSSRAIRFIDWPDITHTTWITLEECCGGWTQPMWAGWVGLSGPIVAEGLLGLNKIWICEESMWFLKTMVLIQLKKVAGGSDHMNGQIIGSARQNLIFHFLSFLEGITSSSVLGDDVSSFGHLDLGIFCRRKKERFSNWESRHWKTFLAVDDLARSSKWGQNCPFIQENDYMTYAVRRRALSFNIIQYSWKTDFSTGVHFNKKTHATLNWGTNTKRRRVGEEKGKRDQRWCTRWTSSHHRPKRGICCRCPESKINEFVKSPNQKSVNSSSVKTRPVFVSSFRM